MMVPRLTTVPRADAGLILQLVSFFMMVPTLDNLARS